MIWRTFYDEESESYSYVTKIVKNLTQYVCKIEKIILSDEYNLSIFYFDEKGNYQVLKSVQSLDHKELISTAVDTCEKI